MQIQELADYTAQILLDYYENRIQPFLDACDEDVLWIGPAVGQVIRTKKALVAAFAAEKHELRFAVHNLTATLLPTGSSHVMNIFLSFLVDTFWPDGSSVRVYQRIVFTTITRPTSVCAIFRTRLPMTNGTVFIRFTTKKPTGINWFLPEKPALTGSASAAHKRR